MTKRNCAVEGCDQPGSYTAGGGLCGKHHWRWKKYGTTADRPVRPEICIIDGCAAPARSRDMCNKHYTRWQRHGDPLALPPRHNWAGENVTYRALHKRIERMRGLAANHRCADCDRQAAQWSYQGGDPDERIERGLRFTPNIEAYVPRCLSCHKRLDDPNPVGLRYRWASHREAIG